MLERLRRLFNEGKITESGLDFWVGKGVITDKQKDEIIRSNNTDASDN